MSNTKKALAIEALSSGLSVEKASELSGVSRACVYKWLSLSDFQGELKEKQAEYFSRLSKRITALTFKALGVLENSIDSRDERIRLIASEIITARFPVILSLSDFETRLSALENRK